ncbi:MAG: hypothetical protein FWD38_03765 [Oscillospiraceae bacterium]|nr:hypothetical protein [Oscillospiraceae bacterium]
MYIDNIYVSYVTAENSINPSQNQQVKGTENESSLFSEILTDSINESTPPHPVVTECTVKGADDVEGTNVNNTYPMDSVPPVIKTQETAGSSYVSKYYPIPEDEVVQGISNVRHIINNTDLSAKTDVEKYDFIESKFIDKFGSDFMMARNLSLPSTMFYLIGVEFTDTLSKHIENPEQVNRERLYGDKSSDSIQDTIRDKYPADLTNRDLFLMVNEMRNSGVLDSASLRSVGAENVTRVIDTLGLIKNYTRFTERDSNNNLTPLSMEERDKKWLSIMNNRININELLYLHNVLKSSGRVNIGTDTAPFFVKHMGGVLDNNGYFILPGSGEADWDQLLDLLMSEMNEYDDFICDRMKLIDGTPPTVVLEAPGAEENIVTEDDTGVEEIPGTDETPGTEDYTGEEGSNGAEENNSQQDEAA